MAAVRIPFDSLNQFDHRIGISFDQCMPPCHIWHCKWQYCMNVVYELRNRSMGFRLLIQFWNVLLLLHGSYGYPTEE